MERRSGLTRRQLLHRGAAVGVAGTLGGALPSAAWSAARRAPTVAVFGGGIAGLTAAHELAERGFRVSVFERKALGGKARSIAVPDTGRAGRRDLPAEHGFRAEFSFYQNLPETMGRIPFRGNENGVRDNMVPVSQAHLSRAGGEDLTAPIAFEAPAHYDPVQMWETVFAGLRQLRDIPPDQLAFFARQVAMYFSSGDLRRFGQWEYVNWYDYTRAGEMSEDYRKQLAEGLTRNLAAAKPQDMSVNSTGIVGESFAYSLMYRPRGPSDQVLNAPTNEAWIDPWLARLRDLGVKLRVGQQLARWEFRRGRVDAAIVKDARGNRRRVEADYYVSALPVERARRLFNPRDAARRTGARAARARAHGVDERRDLPPRPRGADRPWPRLLRGLGVRADVDQPGAALGRATCRASTATAARASRCRRSSRTGRGRGCCLASRPGRCRVSR